MNRSINNDVQCCGAKKKAKVESFGEVEQNISTVSHAINYQEEAQVILRPLMMMMISTIMMMLTMMMMTMMTMMKMMMMLFRQKGGLLGRGRGRWNLDP